MPHSLPTFHIMPAGWDYPAWVEEFYPEDLPEDWRLSYFANEFSEVLVPQVSWVDAGTDQLQSWIDDVSEDFRFFLEISDPVELSICDKQAEVLGSNLGGLVLAQNIAEKGWCKEFVAMDQQHGGKVFLMTEASFYKPMPTFPQSAGMGVALSFTGKDCGDLAAQRGFFQQLQEKVQPDAQVLLCFAGAPPALESINKLRLLARLMGLA
ncbi:MAG: hypothetical protein ABFS39_00630 [Pseudomonadota bacterium]